MFIHPSSQSQASRATKHGMMMYSPSTYKPAPMLPAIAGIVPLRCVRPVPLAPPPRRPGGPFLASLNSAYLDKSLCAAGLVFGSVLTLARVHQKPAGEKEQASPAGS